MRCGALPGLPVTTVRHLEILGDCHGGHLHGCNVPIVDLASNQRATDRQTDFGPSQCTDPHSDTAESRSTRAEYDAALTVGNSRRLRERRTATRGQERFAYGRGPCRNSSADACLEFGYRPAADLLDVAHVASLEDSQMDSLIRDEVQVVQQRHHHSLELVSIQRDCPEVTELVSYFVLEPFSSKPVHSHKLQKHPVHGRPRNSGSTSHLPQRQSRCVTKAIHHHRQSVES